MSRPQLTHINRIELAILLKEDLSKRQIAAAIGVHHSTICRELARNKTNNPAGYHAGQAHRWAIMRRSRANQAFRKLPANQKLVRVIVEKLEAIWSPEQIAGWLRSTGRRARVCAQTIYDWIYTFRPDLKPYLHCRKGQYRRTRAARLRLQRRNQELAKRRVDQRPQCILGRKRLGSLGRRHGRWSRPEWPHCDVRGAQEWILAGI